MKGLIKLAFQPVVFTVGAVLALTCYCLVGRRGDIVAPLHAESSKSS